MRRISSIGALIGIARKGDHASTTDQRIQQQWTEIAHAVAELETLRNDICNHLDRRARLVLPPVLLVIVVTFIALYGWSALILELPRLILLSALLILISWLFLQHRSARIYRRTMRTIIGHSIALALQGFTHTPDPVISKDKLRRWPLFPHVSAVEGADMFTGQRAGHDVTLCRLNVNYHYKAQQRRESHKQSNLHAICIKLDTNPLGGVSAVILPNMIDNRIHKAIKGKHGLPAVAPIAGLEKQFLAFAAADDILERIQKRLSQKALHELAQRDRVILAFGGGQTIALFPLESDIFVPFAALPYWQPVDPKAIMLRIGNDLAQMEDRLNMVLALQEP